jgi:hypothetical protein
MGESIYLPRQSSRPRICHRNSSNPACEKIPLKTLTCNKLRILTALTKYRTEASVFVQHNIRLSWFLAVWWCILEKKRAEGSYTCGSGITWAWPSDCLLGWRTPKRESTPSFFQQAASILLWALEVLHRINRREHLHHDSLRRWPNWSSIGCRKWVAKWVRGQICLHH